ncbi:MAG: hypothetical protein AABX50_02070 [Nanoarchaeota archaeon]
MRILHQITEDEVITNFLKSEINSKRFRKPIILALKNKSKKIILHPNLKDRKENQFRRKLLGKVRGFGMNRDLFENFPNNVKWFKAFIKRQELKNVKYINYSYWNELSNKTRLPSEASKNVQKGLKIFNVDNEGFQQILSKIKKGKKLPDMIFVAKNKKSRMVILEGHARMTGYFLEPKHIPKKLEIIIGYSNKINKWGLY